MEVEKKKRLFNPDRIVLNAESVTVLGRLREQINLAFGGMIKLSNKDLANFLIQQRSSALSEQEVLNVKSEFFDDVTAAQWVLKKLKDAKGKGEHLSLKEVIGSIQTPQVRKKRAPKTHQEARAVSGNEATLAANSDVAGADLTAKKKHLGG